MDWRTAKDKLNEQLAGLKASMLYYQGNDLEMEDRYSYREGITKAIIDGIKTTYKKTGFNSLFVDNGGKKDE